MTATYDITTEIGQVRRLINDTDVTPASDAQFTNEEIQFFLDLGGSVLMAASKALESWAATYSASPDSETIGDYSYKQGAVKNFIALADKYAKQDATTPVLEISEMDLAAIGDPDTT